MRQRYRVLQRASVCSIYEATGVISVDLAVSECCSIFLSQRTRQLADALIAATAHVHGLTLVTRNVADFKDTGVDIVNPWKWGEPLK